MRTFLLALTICALSPGSSAAREPAIENIDAKAAKALVAGEGREVTVLDVRTPAEFAAGHLEGAKNIDFKADDFAARLGQLDKTKPYLVHCRSGRRSTASLEAFKKLGFAKVYHLDGGFLAWEKAGGAVVKP